MTVYHALGDSFELAVGEWLNFLALAIGKGWQPTAPERPAISFDLDARPATGANTPYDFPVGQIMPAGNVHSLAHALRMAVKTSSATLKDRVAEFCLFCETGGSVLLSAAAPPPSAVSVSPDTKQLLRLFLSLAVDLDPKTENPATHTIRYQLGK